MTPDEIMRKIREFSGDGIVTISPGPIRLKVGEDDKRAFVLLDWLKEKHPEATVQETISTLMSAYWWVIYWSCMEDAK